MEYQIRSNVGEATVNGVPHVVKFRHLMGPGRKTVPINEAAAYQIAAALGVRVPKTFVRQVHGGLASFQEYVPRPCHPYSDDVELTPEEIAAAYVFDILIGNVDRRPEHILIGGDGLAYLIDNGFSLAFHLPKERVERRRNGEEEWDFDFFSPYSVIRHPFEKKVDLAKAWEIAYKWSKEDIRVRLPGIDYDFVDTLNMMIRARQDILVKAVIYHAAQATGQAVVIDIDGVLTQDPFPKDLPWGYLRMTPDPKAIEALRELARNYSIILYTSRPEKDRKATETWLFSHGIPYNILVMNKPYGRHYIDDRAVRFRSWDEVRCELPSLFESSAQV